MPVPVELGDDEFDGASEHPCVRRLRHRRLLAFLWLQGMGDTFGSMVHETDAFFSVVHLQHLMMQGQWRDAKAYLLRFLKLDDYSNLSLEAQVLHRFILAHMNLADILADTKEGLKLSEFFCKYRRHDSAVCHGTIRLRSIMLTALHAKHHLRASFDWERVRQRAARIAYKLVHKTPELKRVVALPAGSMKPHNVLPIRTSCTRQRFRPKKHPFQLRASALAKHYLQRRGSLLSSSPSKESDSNCIDLFNKATSWVADILDECLQAGKPHELRQKHPLKTSGKQDTSIVPSRGKGTFGSLAGPAKNLGLTSVENAGKLALHVPTLGAPFLGTMRSHCETSGSTLMASTGLTAGAPVAPVTPVTQALNYTSHADDSGSPFVVHHTH